MFFESILLLYEEQSHRKRYRDAADTGIELVAFQYLTEDNLSDKYTEAKDYTEKLTAPFPEFERIAGNKPAADRDHRYSDVTDGTAASVVRKAPKRTVQQVPTGKVTSDNDDDWLPIIAGFVLFNKIIPYANLDYDFITKCWQIIEDGGKFGSKFTYTPYVNHDGYFCSDLSLPYWADGFLPPGYKSGYAAPYFFLRTWWQEEDVDAQIAQEKRLKRNAKRRGDEYDSSWDYAALKTVKKAHSTKKDKEQSPSEKDRGTNPEGIEIVTGFQLGVDAPFLTFCPAKGDEKKSSSITIIRRKPNKDPRGKYPIDWFYFDTDGSNPLGRGVIELIGPLQNLIDTEMAMFQWGRALMLAPPVFTYGIKKSKVVYAPNAIMEMNKPDGFVKPLDIDTSAIEHFPENFGLMKSQLLNLVSSPDTSISAEVGNPGFSKTDAGVKQQATNVSVDDNYTRKNFEAWFENWCETAVNVYFAEKTGTDVIQLNQDTVDQLQKLADKGKFDMSKINENNEIMIDFDDATPALKFRADASSSKVKDEALQLEATQGLIEMYDTTPTLQQIVPQDKVIGLWNAAVKSSAFEDPEAITVDIKEFQVQQQQQQELALAQASADQAKANATMATTAAAGQPGQPIGQPGADVDSQIAEQLRAKGVPDDLINQALQMANSGRYTSDEIMQAVQGAMSNGQA